MTILFINTLYSPHIGGGAEVICQEQVEGFQRRGYTVSVLTTSPNLGLCQEDVNGITVYRAGIKNFIGILAIQSQINMLECFGILEIFTMLGCESM
ncbi:hypothetical protein NXX61_13760 [Bacteroides ovatus]|nr:hypothetical protein [Bacteroides ovatus]